VLKPIDDTPAWSISCLFVAREYRKRGVSVQLLRAAVEHVRQCGGEVVEGYPVEPKKGEMPAVFAWTGLPSAFLKAGFTEAARGSPTRPIMRLDLRTSRKKTTSQLRPKVRRRT
jgi:GNAT superfamily N-acetyltransferase